MTSHSPAPQFRHLEIAPQTPALGAVVLNVDASRPLSDDVAEEILLAHGHYGVLFMHDQDLTPEQHIQFAESLGEINVNRFFRPVEGYPRIAQVLKEPDQTTNIGSRWHTDHSYDTEPALGSILYAREVPPIGGDTLFASMYLAWETLSEGMQQMLSGLRAVHSSAQTFGKIAYGTRKNAKDIGNRLGNQDAATQDSVHPIGITHPVTGRKVLYINAEFTTHIEGWTPEESKPLLESLYRHATRSEFTCRFAWRKGSLAFWDNRCTWHHALNDYQGYRRLMHRITLEGTALH